MTHFSQHQESYAHTQSSAMSRQGKGEESLDRKLSAYDYELSEAFIAQSPVSPRDHSRLLVARWPVPDLPSPIQCRDVSPEWSAKTLVSDLTYDHRQFFNLPDYLQPGDLLVLNNTRVIPARLYGYKVYSSDALPQRKPSLVEVFLLEKHQHNQWLALVRPGKRLKPGVTVQFGPTPQGLIVYGHIQSIDESTGGRLIDFQVYEYSGAAEQSDALAVGESLMVEGSDRRLQPSDRSLLDVLPELGDVPLPPYISNDDIDAERYQTVYSDRPGAVAAPTAGLHFTPSLLQELEDMGVQRAFITLHVGVGTFRPVEVENITTHKMHGEWIEIPEETVAQIQATKANGGRVIAVGTTATRALEGAAQAGQLKPFQGKTDIFIYPGYEWQVIDGLITNFHLPKSSLMMMVSALIGRENLLALYQEAIAQQYRFYSFGDAMLLLSQDSK